MSITNGTQHRKVEDNTMAEMVELVASAYMSRPDDNGPTRLIGQALKELAAEIRLTHARNANDFEDRRACYDKWAAEKAEIDAVERERINVRVQQTYMGA